MSNVASKKDLRNWLGVSDAAKLIGVSTSRVRQMVLAGDIKNVVVLSKRVRLFDADEIRAIARQDRRPGPKPRI